METATEAFSRTETIKAYLENQDGATSTQEILDSGRIPFLKAFRVIPGKVSDSIVGGKVSFLKDGEKVTYTNPPLKDKHGIPLRIMVRTERISTHDVGRGIIPFKDQILAANHNFMRRLVSPYMPHAQLETDLSDISVVTVSRNVSRFPIENVLRAFLAESTTTTNLYYQWTRGAKNYCGIDLTRYSDYRVANGRLPYVMDTPSTKDDSQDKSVPIEDLFVPGQFEEWQWRHIRNSALVAYGVVSQYLKQKDLILVDTKTEHGQDENSSIYAIDELYTMDSSRFWKIKDGSLLLDDKGSPVSFSKEFARGLSKGTDPYTKEEQIMISARYMEGIEHLTGQKFIPDRAPWDERVVRDITLVLQTMI